MGGGGGGGEKKRLRMSRPQITTIPTEITNGQLCAEETGLRPLLVPPSPSRVTHVGVENAELLVDTAEFLVSEPDMENPKDDPRSPDCSGGSEGRLYDVGPLGGKPVPKGGARRTSWRGGGGGRLGEAGDGGWARTRRKDEKNVS